MLDVPVLNDLEEDHNVELSEGMIALTLQK